MPNPQEIAEQLLAQCYALANPEDREMQARFGVKTDKALGIRNPVLKDLAKPYKRNPELSEILWYMDYRETRMMAALVGDPKQVTGAQMERWVVDVDSWDVCDNLMGALFAKAAPAYEKANAWAVREEEFVKRSGFVLIATMAVHRKKDPHDNFLEFLPLIEQEAYDDRNFVKKAVNWALRQIGKRHASLHPAALASAKRLSERPEAAARWIGKDALRELQSEKVKAKLGI